MKNLKFIFDTLENFLLMLKFCRVKYCQGEQKKRERGERTDTVKIRKSTPSPANKTNVNEENE